MADDDDIERLRRRLSMANRTLDDLTSTVDELTDRLARFRDVVDTLEGDGDDDDPGVESEPRHPPEPSDITFETMADVIDGYAALEQESTEVWRCEIGQ